VAIADEIADNEKVTDEPGFFDDLEFQLQPVNNGFYGLGDGGSFMS